MFRQTFLPVAVLAAIGLSSAAAAATLDKIKSTGTLTLGYRESSVPFSYLGADQKPVGLSIDLCAAVAEAVKAKLAMPGLKVAMTPVNASNRIPLIQNGTVDLECGSTTNTADRQKQVAFSVATFVSQPSWLTMAASGISDLAGLKGKTVVVTQGSLNYALAQKITKENNLDLVFVQAKDQAESLLMLRTGRAAGWFEDRILQAGLAASAPDPKAFKFLPGQFGGFDYYGLMFAKDDPDFKAVVDGAIRAQMASGAFAKLYEKWFTQPIPPNGQNLSLPMGEALRARVAAPSDALTP
nr:amino acid ABC transporter substrate-binding protein [Aquabacter spiritensis]